MMFINFLVSYARRSYLGIWEWTNEIAKQRLERFGCYSGRRPSEPTIRQVIQKLDQTVITMDVLLAQKNIAEKSSTGILACAITTCMYLFYFTIHHEP